MLFQEDSNLVIYDISGRPIWASSTYDGSSDTFRIKTHYWQFHDDHMFISDKVGRAAWGSFPSIAHNNMIIWLRSQLGGPSNYCLDAWENKSGYPTKLNAWNGKGGQRWNVFPDGTIRNKDTNQCLYVQDSENESVVYTTHACGDPLTIWQVNND